MFRNALRRTSWCLFIIKTIVSLLTYPYSAQNTPNNSSCIMHKFLYLFRNELFANRVFISISKLFDDYVKVFRTYSDFFSLSSHIVGHVRKAKLRLEQERQRKQQSCWVAEFMSNWKLKCLFLFSPAGSFLNNASCIIA